MTEFLSIQALADGVRSSDRAATGRALTLVESKKPEDIAHTRELIQILQPFSGKSLRVAITGIPGAGKSTFIDSLSPKLLDAGHKVAVLAVDPSSAKSGGSILGDKTRMSSIASHPSVFVRPSPAGQTLGGTTSSTRESIIILEAAGYDIVFLETVGVGQAEFAAVNMVDFFILLVIPGQGMSFRALKGG